MVEFPPPDPDLAGLARKNLIYNADAESAGTRLDKFVSSKTGLSRVLVRELIGFGSVWVRGRVCRRQSHPVSDGDWVTLQVPEYGPRCFYEADRERILYQDKWLLAYDKEAGIPCQQTPYDGYNHLFGALQRMFAPGYLALHHRLDRLTSGVMVFARQQEANKGLSRIFKNGPLVKKYLAVADGLPSSDTWETDLPIAKRKGSYYCPPDGRGKPARTEFSVLARAEDRCLIMARPHTGRTHQIRLHLEAAGHPIRGDRAYGGPPDRRMMLHAWSISFPHPATGKKMEIRAPRPAGFWPDPDMIIQ